MATTLYETKGLVATRFYGGETRGVMMEFYFPETGETFTVPAVKAEVEASRETLVAPLAVMFE